MARMPGKWDWEMRGSSNSNSCLSGLRVRMSSHVISMEHMPKAGLQIEQRVKR